jgi:hypothetical protein
VSMNRTQPIVDADLPVPSPAPSYAKLALSGPAEPVHQGGSFLNLLGVAELVEHISETSQGTQAQVASPGQPCDQGHNLDC